MGPQEKQPVMDRTAWPLGLCRHACLCGSLFSFFIPSSFLSTPYPASLSFFPNKTQACSNLECPQLKATRSEDKVNVVGEKAYSQSNEDTRYKSIWRTDDKRQGLSELGGKAHCVCAIQLESCYLLHTTMAPISLPAPKKEIWYLSEVLFPHARQSGEKGHSYTIPLNPFWR